VHRLASDQMNRLLEIIREQSGDKLSRAEFTDAMLQMFENIAGFETLPATLRRKYLKLLWLRYQIDCRPPARNRKAQH
jgi:hypothetical protein